MEKKYIKPTSKVVYVGSETLMAGSDPAVNNKLGNGSQFGKENHDDWDD